MFKGIFIYKYNQFVRQLEYSYFRLVIHSKWCLFFMKIVRKV